VSRSDKGIRSLGITSGNPLSSISGIESSFLPDDTVSVLWMQYFFIRIIFGIMQWESVCNHIFPADVWIYYSVPFGIAEIFRGNGRMACSTVCGAFHAYADDISAIQASKTV